MQSVGIYREVEPKDVEQEMWLAIWKMTAGLEEDMYVELAYEDVCATLRPERMRSVEDGDKYVKELPVSSLGREGMEIDELRMVSPYDDGFADSVLTKIEMEQRLEGLNKRLYKKYLRHNREAYESERHNSRKFFQHYIGWSEQELADIFGVSQPAIHKRINRIRRILEDVVQGE